MSVLSIKRKIEVILRGLSWNKMKEVGLLILLLKDKLKEIRAITSTKTDTLNLEIRASLLVGSKVFLILKRGALTLTIQKLIMLTTTLQTPRTILGRLQLPIEL